MASKLDWLMIIVFEFLDSQFGASGGGSMPSFPRLFSRTELEVQSPVSTVRGQDEAETLDADNSQLFDQLLQSFKTKILSASQLKFVQFIVFYLCSRSIEFTEIYLSVLITNIFMKEPHDQRMCTIECIQYLASFMARATYIQPDLIEKILCKYLIGYLEDYLRLNAHALESNTGCLAEQMFKHNMRFYQLAQAVLYIVIFCQHTLPTATVRLVLTRMEPILGSVLKPCQFISSRILAEAAEVGKTLKLNSLIETIAQTSRGKKLYLVNQFFPFDPYLLELSHKYVAGIYREWSQSKDASSATKTEPQRERSEQKIPFTLCKNQSNCSTTYSDDSQSRGWPTPLADYE